MKLQQVLIVVLALVISLLLVTLLAGRNNTATIIVAASDKIDTNTKLDEQVQYFQEKKVLKSDLDVFGGTAVTSLNQLKGQYLIYKPKLNEPILVSNLSQTKASGQFATELTKYHTVFKITDGKAALPSGVQPGDKIDILSILQPKDKADGIIIGPVLTSVTIQSIDDTNVYVYVSQAEAARLTLTQEIGKFVLQLPGQKSDSLKCSDVKTKNSSVTCYTNNDMPNTLSEQQLRDYISNNDALGISTVQSGLTNLTSDNSNSSNTTNSNGLNNLFKNSNSSSKSSSK